MYRNRKNNSKKLAAMRAAKERKRIDSNATDRYDFIPSKLRRKIVITDYDFGEVTHTIELYSTNRIDCYRAVADGKPWQYRIGWAKVLEGVRKSFIRVMAINEV